MQNKSIWKSYREVLRRQKCKINQFEKVTEVLRRQKCKINQFEKVTEVLRRQKCKINQFEKVTEVLRRQKCKINQLKKKIKYYILIFFPAFTDIDLVLIKTTKNLVISMMLTL